MMMRCARANEAREKKKGCAFYVCEYVTNTHAIIIKHISLIAAMFFIHFLLSLLLRLYPRSLRFGVNTCVLVTQLDHFPAQEIKITFNVSCGMAWQSNRSLIMHARTLSLTHTNTHSYYHMSQGDGNFCCAVFHREAAE
jgi:hypothetical protein